VLSIEGEFLAHKASNRLCRFQCVSSFCRCYDIAGIAKLNSIGIEEFQVGLGHREAFINIQTAGKQFFRKIVRLRKNDIVFYEKRLQVFFR